MLDADYLIMLFLNLFNVEFKKIKVKVDVLFDVSATAHLDQEGVSVNERLDSLEENFISLFARAGDALPECSPRPMAVLIHNQSDLLWHSSRYWQLQLLLAARHVVILHQAEL